MKRIGRNAMTERTRLTEKSLEALVLVVLKTQLGLGHIDYVKLRAVEGEGKWEISEIGTKREGADRGAVLALANASEAIGKLQQQFVLEKV
jgi:hypothetical protein